MSIPEPIPTNTAQASSTAQADVAQCDCNNQSSSIIAGRTRFYLEARLDVRAFMAQVCGSRLFGMMLACRGRSVPLPDDIASYPEEKRTAAISAAINTHFAQRHSLITPNVVITAYRLTQTDGYGSVVNSWDFPCPQYNQIKETL